MTSSTGSSFGSSKNVQSRWNKNAQRKTGEEACPGMQVATECCFHLWHVPRQPRTLMERVFAVRGPLGVRHSGKSINPSANRHRRTDLTVTLYPGYLHAKSLQFSSVQCSRSVVSDSLRPHESQHTRPPCPSPIPRVHSDSRASSQWCHPAISSSVVPFSSCPQSLPASESFPVSQLFAWGGQSTGVSALASLLPKKSQGWSPSEWISNFLLMKVVAAIDT